MDCLRCHTHINFCNLEQRNFAGNFFLIKIKIYVKYINYHLVIKKIANAIYEMFNDKIMTEKTCCSIDICPEIFK